MTDTTRRRFMQLLASASSVLPFAGSASATDHPSDDTPKRVKRHQLVYWEPPLGVGRQYLDALERRLDEKLRAFDGCVGVSACSWPVAGTQQAAFWVKMEMGVSQSRAEQLRGVTTDLLAHERQRHVRGHLDRK